MENRTPRTFRPRYALYRAFAAHADKVGDDLWSEAETAFVAGILSHSGGSASPDAARALYSEIMREAGLVPLPW